MAQAFLKINGFHTATTGNANGIGEFLQDADESGVPFLAYCVRGTTSLIDAQNIIRRSSVPHNAIFRQDYFPHNQGGSDVPDYNKAPHIAAREQWESHVARIPPELDLSIIWTETVNELRKEREWANWIGEFCYETGLLALRDGLKWCGPGYSSGTPDEGSWRTPGMVKFLNLCAKHPDQIAVALHEYSLDPNDIWHNYPHHVGRFEHLMDEVEYLGIKPPTIFITEFGWGDRDVPPRAEAIRQIIDIGEVYAPYPNVKGAAIWCLDGGWGIDKEVNGWIPYLAEAMRQTRYEVDDVTEPEEKKYRVVANLVPQTWDKEQVKKVVDRVWPETKESVVGSADDAGNLVTSPTARADSIVRAWHPEEWGGDLRKWFAEKYGAVVEYAYLETEKPKWPIPSSRRDMPLIVDISRYQDWNQNSQPDDIDFTLLRQDAGVKALIIRATDGKTPDKMYNAWLTKADEQGWPHGNYHRLSKFVSVQDQILAFLRTRASGLLGDWLDVEAFYADIPTPEMVQQWVEAHQQATGNAPLGIYTNEATWETYIKLDLGLPLWVANFESSPGSLTRPVAIPQPWKIEEWGHTNKNIWIWQYGAYKLPGAKAPIDCNVFHSSHEEFDERFPSKMPVKPPALVGLHSGADGGVISAAELREFDGLKPGVIKIMSSMGGDSVSKLGEKFPDVHYIVRAFLDFGGRRISAQQFVNDTANDVIRAITRLPRRHPIKVELHNEPNLQSEGYSISWRDGAEFNDWYLDVLNYYTNLGLGVEFMFPGLSPGQQIGETVRADSWKFLGACAGAVNASDALGVHAYWAPQNGWSMEKTFDQLRPIFHLWAGRKPIWITEASNNKSGVVPDVKAAEYAKFVNAPDIRGYVQGVTFFVASASNPAWQWGGNGTGETWTDADMGRLVRWHLDHTS